MRTAIIGGTGFVGSYLIDALLAAGHSVSLLVRPGSRSKLRRADECRVVDGNVEADGAVRSALEGCDAIIYNIGILREFPRQGITFESTQFDGVVRAIDAARKAGVTRFLLMSANGVKQPGTPYQETKYRAEQAVRDSGLDCTIFRPSVIFGDPRGTMEIATQLYRDMIKPAIPALGFHTGWKPAAGQIVMSPVHVRDVADAFVHALGDRATIGKTYALGGPEELSWTTMLQRVAAAAGKRKLILPMPAAVMKLAATLFDWLPFFPVTRDQLSMLAEGNTVAVSELEIVIGRKALVFASANLEYLRA